MPHGAVVRRQTPAFYRRPYRKEESTRVSRARSSHNGAEAFRGEKLSRAAEPFTPMFDDSLPTKARPLQNFSKRPGKCRGEPRRQTGEAKNIHYLCSNVPKDAACCETELNPKHSTASTQPSCDTLGPGTVESFQLPTGFIRSIRQENSSADGISPVAIYGLAPKMNR